MRLLLLPDARLGDLELTAGGDRLATHRFNTGAAEHHFCPDCGIYTHHRRRSNPRELGVNVACLAGLGPFDFAGVPIDDGIHHPADGGGGDAGRLRYEPGVRGVVRVIPGRGNGG